MCDFSEYGGMSAAFRDIQLEPASIKAPKEQTIEESKRTANKQREEASSCAMKFLAKQVVMKNHVIHARDGYRLEARTYRSSSLPPTDPLPVYIHLHGGGYLLGTLDSEDAACARIASAIPIIVLNLNYRHTPEWTYPTAWNDSEDALEWTFGNANALAADPTQIVVGGISAGGHIGAALVQKFRGDPRIRGQVLMIPCLAHYACYEPQLRRMRDRAISSYTENQLAPRLPLTRLKQFHDLLLANQHPEPGDKRLNPGNVSADDVVGLPPTLVCVAGLDMLRDEGLLYAKLLSRNG